jgi:hypothetical protein
VCIHPLLTGYANEVEGNWKERKVDLGSRRGCSGPGSGYGILGVHEWKMLPLLPPSVLFSGSPMHRPTSPKLRRKGTGEWKEMAVKGDGDVEMLDGDGGMFFSLLCYYFFFLSCFYTKNQTDYLNSFSRSHPSTTNNVRLDNTLFDSLVTGSSRTCTAQVNPVRWPHKMAAVVVVVTSIWL